MAWFLKGKREMDAMQEKLAGIVLTVAQYERLRAVRAARNRARVDDLAAHGQSHLPDCGLTPAQHIAADIAAVLNKHRLRSPGELADGLTAALMAQVPPSVAIQALSAAIGK